MTHYFVTRRDRDNILDHANDAILCKYVLLPVCHHTDKYSNNVLAVNSDLTPHGAIIKDLDKGDALILSLSGDYLLQNLKVRKLVSRIDIYSTSYYVNITNISKEVHTSIIAILFNK